HSSPTADHTLSLHDALPISAARVSAGGRPLTDAPSSSTAASVRNSQRGQRTWRGVLPLNAPISLPRSRSVRFSPPTRNRSPALRSEEHTSELQSRSDLVCRL